MLKVMIEVTNRMKSARTLGISLLTLLLFATHAVAQQRAFSAGTWTAIKHAPSAAIGHTMLLPDGSVLALASTCNATGNWLRLVPDSTGSYLNGTWVAAGNLPAGYNPTYFASQVLPSGLVVIFGGEYNACNKVWTTLGAYYNPNSNKWAPLKAPAAWATVGDAQSITLPSGQMMLANCCTTDEAILTLSGGVASWTPTGTGKADANDEEGWTMLPGNNILVVDAYTSGGCCAKGFQIYNPKTGAWTTPSGNTVVNLVDPSSSELGPGALLPNGTVFYAGGTTNNAIYNVKTGKWSAAPSFGSGLDMADGPAAVLPDGNLLLDTSPGVFNNGSVFFEWDGTALHKTTAPPNAPIDPSYAGNMLVLPTGQILLTDFTTSVEIYTPKGTSCTGCAPTITAVASTLTHGTINNSIKGTQFNGLTQGSYYGDDNQSFTNYPLVRITDSKAHVIYCKTHGWHGWVATGPIVVGVQFDIPSTIALGAATLEVVTNGIPSLAVAVTIN
jgi:hypothetical protein